MKFSRILIFKLNYKYSKINFLHHLVDFLMIKVGYLLVFKNKNWFFKHTGILYAFRK